MDRYIVLSSCIYSTLLYSTLLYSTLLYSTLLYSTPLTHDAVIAVSIVLEVALCLQQIAIGGLQ